MKYPFKLMEVKDYFFLKENDLLMERYREIRNVRAAAQRYSKKSGGKVKFVVRPLTEKDYNKYVCCRVK